MVREKKAKASGKKAVRDPERPRKPWDRDEEGLPFEEHHEDAGPDDYIWPECGPEDEDEL